LKRREFITLLGGAAAWPLGARAQHTAKAPTLGLLYPGPQAPVPSRVEALLDGLRAAGFLPPAQVEIVLRVADNDPSRIAPLAAEIVKSNVDAILAVSAEIVRAFRAETSRIPLVALDLESVRCACRPEIRSAPPKVLEPVGRHFSVSDRYGGL